MSVRHPIVYSTQGELELGSTSLRDRPGAWPKGCSPTTAGRMAQGQSFRVHARKAWGYPSLELRAGNSWPAVTLDCDVPSAVVDALYWNHHGGDGPALPRPNMVVERQSNGHCHASWFLSRPVHRGESARAHR